MKNSVNYESFLSRHDLVWKKLPRKWYEGPFVGNGSTGVVAYFDNENNLYLNIGDTSVYDNRKESELEKNKLFLTPRLPLGGFVLKSIKGYEKCDMRLSLYNAEFFGNISSLDTDVKFDCFTVENDKAFIFTWTNVEGESCIEYKPLPAVSPRQTMMIEINDDRRLCKNYDEPHPAHQIVKDGFVTHIQPKFCGGEYRVNYKIFKNGKENTLVCFIENIECGEKSDIIASDRLTEIYEKRDALKKEHRDFWHEFYRKSFLSLDDTKLEGFYWIQLYKCACATRKGCHIYDTTGPWLGKSTSWPAEWWNLNVQLNYSPLYPSNHPEIAESLIETISVHLDDLKNNVPERYRNGEYCVIGRDATRDLKSPSAIPGECTIKNDLELGNLIWALHNCYVHLCSQADDERLASFLFPILKGATEYITVYLYKGEDGKLHLPPTTSPEYLEIGTDCAYNISLLKWGLITLIKLDERLSLHHKNRQLWENILSELCPLPSDEKEGIKIAADVSLAVSHRHYSHLLAFYPLHILDERDKAERELVEKSIAHWHSMPEALEGYSQTGAASMYAYLGDGNKALKHINNLFDGFIQPNTMYYEQGGPVLETPPAAARSMLDMVFISVGDELRIFSGTPSSWKNVAFCNLLTEQGCEISAVRRNGKLVFLTVLPKKDCKLKLYADLKEEMPVSGCTLEKKDDFYIINLSAGMEAAIGTKEEVMPVESKPEFENCFGLS